MEFTYVQYEHLISLLRENRYTPTDYHEYARYPRCVILRHDIDTSLEQAVRLAELEARLDVKSTYFVLLRTSFYNTASKSAQKMLRRIHDLGHEIGLHFDELAYETGDEPMEARIQKEAAILAALCGFPITSVSMHRPSKETLESNLQIPGLVNSYGQTFFRDFKYLSDSRRNWREPGEEIVRSGEDDRLHILTHAFWYHEEEETLSETVGAFIRKANRERYAQMAENIRDLGEILQENEV